MPIVFKPSMMGRNRTWGSTTHLRDTNVADHHQAMELSRRYAEVSPDNGMFWQEMSWWHKMGALDQETFTKWMAGPMAGKDTRLVAVMDPGDAALMHIKHPNILKDRNEFYKFIKRHEFAAPGVS